MEERVLLDRVRKGDRAAFSVLVEDNQRRIYALALRLTGNTEDAADLAQEVFLKAWQKITTFHGESAFSTWLYRLASNTCIDFLRREKRRRSQTVAFPTEGTDSGRPMDLPDWRFSPQETLEQQERQQALLNGLSALSPEARQILYLREFEGLSYAEIGALLQLPDGTIKSRIARARLSLRKHLQESGNFSGFLSSIE